VIQEAKINIKSINNRFQHIKTNWDNSIEKEDNINKSECNIEFINGILDEKSDVKIE